MQRPPGSHLTLVVDTPVAVYSGMVPGFVAGQYRAGELEIDVVPLARRAGARVILAPALSVDPRNRRIEVEGRPPVPYDVASFDIGSTVGGLGLPGIRRHAFPTRPIGRFVQRVDELVGRLAGGAGRRLVVVGGGAGGVELAFCLHRRLRSVGAVAPEVELVEGGRRILRGYPASLARRVQRAAEERGIRIECGRRVEAADDGELHLDGGETRPFHGLVWVTGAVAHPVLARSGLATDERGFVLVRPTLQVLGHDDLFAVGDCATLLQHPETPKAGVYAVRQGPYVADNLSAWLAGEPLRSYAPQGDFLTLLNRGDGGAFGAKWGITFEGDWVFRWKDWIDRRFMRRFQVLEADGAMTETFAAEPEMAMEGGGEMLCGGCAAKVGQSTLERALRRVGPAREDATVALGLGRADDAAAYAVGDRGLVVTSVDAFRAFTDDPWLVGRAAAVNALSDLEAKGVTPRYALALVTVPEEQSEEEREETLYQVLAGSRVALDAAEVTLLGGHSTTGPELVVGFSVDALAGPGDTLLRLDALRAGQRLVLTKPLGTGVVLHADMRGRARGRWLQAVHESMLSGNGAAARIALVAGATAATDVTGFGLAGHLGSMARAGGVCAVVRLGLLPALPGAEELLALGLRSTAHPQNARARKGLRIAPEAAAHPRFELLFDPQTCGGLVFGVPPESEVEVLARLREEGCPGAAVIGETVAARDDGAPLEIVV